MSLSLIPKGILIGLSIAAPVGPIGLLCIRRSMTEGRVAGFVSGLGAASADAAYGGVAGFGLTALSSWLVAKSSILGLVGGIYLCYLAVKTAQATPVAFSVVVPAQRSRLFAAYLSTFGLTLTNPMTILSFVAIFSGLGIVASSETGGAMLFVAGVFVGSALWWLILSTTVGLLRPLIGPILFRGINWVSGAILLLFGVYSVWRGVRGFL